MDNLKRKRPEGEFGHPRMLNHSSVRPPLAPFVKRARPPPGYHGGEPSRARLYFRPPGPPRQRPPGPRPRSSFARPRPYYNEEPSQRPRQSMPMRPPARPRGGMVRSHRMMRPPPGPHGLSAPPSRRMRLPCRPPPRGIPMRGLPRGHRPPVQILRGPPHGYSRFPPRLPLRGPPRLGLVPSNVRRAPRAPREMHRFPNDVFEVEEESFDSERAIVPAIECGDLLNAASQNTEEVLLKLKPETKFREAQYLCSEGGVYCCEVEVDGILIEAEATSEIVARRLVSFDALMHLQVPAVIHCNMICEIERELLCCAKLRPQYIEETVALYIEQCREDGVASVSEECKRALVKASMWTVRNNAKYFNGLKRDNLFGAGSVLKNIIIKGQNGQSGVQTTVSHNNELWTGIGSTRVAAKNHASALIISHYINNAESDDVRQSMIRARESPVAQMSFEHNTLDMEPATFSDKLVKKAFIVTKELLKDIAIPYNLLRNFACVFKVTGKLDITNCEIVALGNGSKIIDKSNIKEEAIRDCAGEMLAYRAFRRYLLDQIESCVKGDSSVLVQEDGKFALKDDVQFHFFTNYAPFGDMSYCLKPISGMGENPDIPTNLPGGFIARYLARKQDKMSESQIVKNTFVPENAGKIQKYVCLGATHKRALTTIPTPENEQSLHSIVSPSDKIALRAVSGCQGALLSLLLKEPVFFSQYHIGKSLANRHFDLPALERGLWGRLKGVQSNAPTPLINTTEWYVTCSERHQPYCFLWSEGGPVDVLRGPQGMKVPLLRQSGHHDEECISIPEVLAIGEEEIKGGTPSRYNTQNFFNNFKLICKLVDLPVSDIKSMKQSAVQYASTKAAVLTEFRDKGLGIWPGKEEKVDSQPQDEKDVDDKAVDDKDVDDKEVDDKEVDSFTSANLPF